MAGREKINRGIIEPPCNYSACLNCENFKSAAGVVAINPDTSLIIGACHSDPISGASETKADAYSTFGKWLESRTVNGNCPDVARRIKLDSDRES